MSTASLTHIFSWAVPVKPDELGASLESFSRVVPTLRMLRLCHRFGRGPNVHITKLPLELEQQVEEFIVPSRLSDEWEWSDDLRCFESRCYPRTHMSEATPILESAYDEVDLCNHCAEHTCYEEEGCKTKCEAGNSNQCDSCIAADGDECERSCLGLVGQAQDEIGQHCEFVQDEHYAQVAGWQKRIRCHGEGSFENLAKVFRQHFGLAVSFAHVRRSDEASAQEEWPKSKSFRWHEGSFYPIRNTICHLIMPASKVRRQTWISSEMEDEIGSASFSGFQAYEINPNVSAISVDKTSLFKRALKILRLKPHVHPTQKYSYLMPERDDCDQNSAEAQQWPKLVLLTKTEFYTER